MEPSIICKTDLAEMEPIACHDQPLYIHHFALKAMLRERLGEDHAELLTDPVITRESVAGTEGALWLSTYLHDPKVYSALSEEEKSGVRGRLMALLGDVETLIGELRSSGDVAICQLGEKLGLAFHVPALDCIHADGEKVALTCWGFTSAPSQSEEFNLIKTIRSQADEKLGETEDAADAPSTKIRIRVVDKEERPAPNIRVTASYKEASAESHTDSEGRASFPKVPLPSDVKLLITLPEYPAFETHVLCEKADEEHLIPLPFVFKPKAVMRFQVMNAKKRGLKKVPLRLEWKKGELEDTTDSEGRSEFSDIPLGEKLTLHVCHSKKAPLVKEFQCCQGEELHQIVIDPPKRNYKRLIWIIVCIFVLSAVGIPIWWLTKAPPAPSEQPAVSHPLQTGTAVRQSGEDCRCKEEIDALWEEIRRMKDEI